MKKNIPNSTQHTLSVNTESQNTEDSLPSNGFSGLHESLLKALRALGFSAPTEVQKSVMPVALSGKDCMVSSQTGSGKTAAFLLPVLQNIILNKAVGKNGKSLALVLCPTRELAQQVANDAIALLRFAPNVKAATAVGGVPYYRQVKTVKKADILIATPGRLIDLCRNYGFSLDKASVLVLDEADRMLDMGFADELNAINDYCAQRSQTMMFSATFESRIMRLGSAMMREPQRIALSSATERHKNIEQKLHWADGLAHKHQLLTHWLGQPSLDQVVIFASTQSDTETIADTLRAKGYKASALHGAMPQGVRNRRLNGLRKGITRVLVATDVAARGLDIPTISHVINFGLPMKAEDYVHRIGRTGRAGRNGTAITLADHRDRSKIMQIEKYTQQSLTADEIPGLEPKERPRFNPRGKKPAGNSRGSYAKRSNDNRRGAAGAKKSYSAGAKWRSKSSSDRPQKGR